MEDLIIISPADDYRDFFPGSAPKGAKNRGYRGEFRFLEKLSELAHDKKLLDSCDEQRQRVRSRKLSNIDKIADAVSSNCKMLDIKTREPTNCGISMTSGVVPKSDVLYVCLDWISGSITKKDELQFKFVGWCFGSELKNISELPCYVWVPKKEWRDIDSLVAELRKVSDF